MFGVYQVKVGYMIYKAPVDLFRDIEVVTPVAGLRAEYGNVETFGHIS